MTARLQIAYVPDGYLLVMDQLTDEDNEAFAVGAKGLNIREVLTGCVGLIAVPFRLDVESDYPWTPQTEVLWKRFVTQPEPDDAQVTPDAAS